MWDLSPVFLWPIGFVGASHYARGDMTLAVMFALTGGLMGVGWISDLLVVPLFAMLSPTRRVRRLVRFAYSIMFSLQLAFFLDGRYARVPRLGSLLGLVLSGTISWPLGACMVYVQMAAEPATEPAVELASVSALSFITWTAMSVWVMGWATGLHGPTLTFPPTLARVLMCVSFLALASVLMHDASVVADTVEDFVDFVVTRPTNTRPDRQDL